MSLKYQKISRLITDYKELTKDYFEGWKQVIPSSDRKVRKLNLFNTLGSIITIASDSSDTDKLVIVAKKDLLCYFCAQWRQSYVLKLRKKKFSLKRKVESVTHAKISL